MLAGSKPLCYYHQEFKSGFKELDAHYHKGLNDRFQAVNIEIFEYPVS
jgi:hypothetical protein